MSGTFKGYHLSWIFSSDHDKLSTESTLQEKFDFVALLVEQGTQRENLNRRSN